MIYIEFDFLVKKNSFHTHIKSYESIDRRSIDGEVFVQKLRRHRFVSIVRAGFVAHGSVLWIPLLISLAAAVRYKRFISFSKEFSVIL